MFTDKHICEKFVQNLSSIFYEYFVYYRLQMRFLYVDHQQILISFFLRPKAIGLHKLQTLEILIKNLP